MKVKAYGKLNLSLNVTGVRGNMHTLDGIMHSVSVYDELTVTESENVRVTVSGADIEEKSNTAYRAAMLIKENYDVSLSADIVKRIPVGGGMGGSSADAAGVFAAASAILGGRMSESDMMKLAMRVGSDVPFMIRGGCARVRGVGDEIEQLPFVPFEALVINCGQVDTAACYRVFDALPHRSAPSPEEAAGFAARGKLPPPYNSLTPAATALLPLIGHCLAAARRAGLNAEMTGSGGCVFVTDPPEGAEEVFAPLRVRVFRTHSVAVGTETESV